MGNILSRKYKCRTLPCTFHVNIGGMICFDVYRNGEKLCRAGKEELTVLTAHVDFVETIHTGDEKLTLHVGGLYETGSGGNAHPRWVERMALNEGDEITFRIVRSDTADAPVSETIDTPEWIEEQERKYYEHVKAKFENNDPGTNSPANTNQPKAQTQT